MISVYGKPYSYIKNTSRIYIVREVSLFLCLVLGGQFPHGAFLVNPDPFGGIHIPGELFSSAKLNS